MSKKNSKPFTEEDLKKKGFIEVAPGVYNKSEIGHDEEGNMLRIDETRTKVPACMPQQETFFYIGNKYNFKPILFIAIPPSSAPRMTQRDGMYLDPNHPDPKKRQRVCVTKYFDFKNSFKSECSRLNVKLTEVLNICFIVPMPESWSKSKRDRMRYEPHKQRPDRDNYLKAYQDAFGADDGYVYDGRTLKIWGETGGMIIF